MMNKSPAPVEERPLSDRLPNKTLLLVREIAGGDHRITPVVLTRDVGAADNDFVRMAVAPYDPGEGAVVGVYELANIKTCRIVNGRLTLADE